MRIQRLEIPAFGPFTNLDLLFADKPCDLHIIYGLNEAGKSSLLRAIRDLFFGIHGHSIDNFLHDYGALRIKGHICNRKGDQLVFQRRKGNKNTLLGADGRQLPDNALVPFLGNVDQTYFSAMFGLGTRELREGAEQLLRGEGNIGNALFSASMGGTPVQRILEALQQEAEGLFKGRSTANVSIRPSVNRFKDLLKQSRDAMVSPEKWEKAISNLDEAEAAKRILEAEISKEESELQWITRCEDALSAVGSLAEEQLKLAQFQDLPDLASNFAPRAQEVRKELAEAQAEVRRLTAQIDRLQELLKGYPIVPVVLAEADMLDQLHQELGAYRTHKNARDDLQTELGEIGTFIRAGMQNLQLAGEFASLENRRVSSPVQLACEESASALKLALAEQAKNSEKIEGLRIQIAAQEDQLQWVLEQDLTALREALAVSEGATEADRTLLTSESDVQRLSRETTDQHRQLPGAPEDQAAAASLPIPAKATIRRYQEQMEASKREIRTEQEKVLEETNRAEGVRAELGRLQLQGELPTEEALRRAREHRDHGWSLVLADWKGDGAKEELIPGLPLEEAFPKTIVNADGISDQLRLRADAVAQAEEKRLQLAEIRARVEATQQRLVEHQGVLEDLDRSWKVEWSASGITPRSPAEMQEWHEQWIGFRELLGRLDSAKDSLQRKRDQIKVAKSKLSPVLNQPEGKEFSLLFEAAKKLVREREQSAGRRIQMEVQLKGLRIELATLEQTRERFANAVDLSNKRWKTQCIAAGLAEDTSPDGGLVLLRERKDLLAKFDQWQASSRKSKVTNDAITQYETAIREKAAALNIVGDTVETLESALWRAITDARKSKDRNDQLAEQIEEAEGKLLDARALVTRSENALRDLLVMASLDTVEKLEPLIACLEQRSAVQAQIDSLRKTLSGPARGEAVDEFVSKVRAENADALVGRKARAAQNRQDKESALSLVRETVFRLRSEKEVLEKAGDTAASFRQQAESEAALLKRDAARYLRLRLATQLLQTQIEQFRKENQGPLLLRSGEIFGAITQGAFSELGADFKADDTPVLVGVRPDQSKVFVEGLSDGSRDQLFLALRLAALDRYLEENEPMPLILDDLLITFDNERVKAILPQLGVLAKRTQIFVFTHHEHLIELCNQTLGRGTFQLHQLG